MKKVGQVAPRSAAVRISGVEGSLHVLALPVQMVAVPYANEQVITNETTDLAKPIDRTNWFEYKWAALVAFLRVLQLLLFGRGASHGASGAPGAALSPGRWPAAGRQRRWPKSGKWHFQVGQLCVYCVERGAEGKCFGVLVTKWPSNERDKRWTLPDCRKVVCFWLIQRTSEAKRWLTLFLSIQQSAALTSITVKNEPTAAPIDS